MMDEDITKEILAYLKEEGPTNTFRLSSKLGLERYKLLDILKKLEEKQAIKFEHGNAIFLKFHSEEKPKPIKIQKSSPKPPKKVKKNPAKPKVLQLLQTENKQLKEKLLELEKTIEKIGKRPVRPPKIITKTIIKKVPTTSKRLKNKLLELEKTIELLEQKAATPKIITKTIIKKVPVTKTIIKEVPAPPIHLAPKEKQQKSKFKGRFKIPTLKLLKNVKQLKGKFKKFKLPKFKGRFKFPKLKLPKMEGRFKIPKFNLLKNVKQLKKPEFAK